MSGATLFHSMSSNVRNLRQEYTDAVEEPGSRDRRRYAGGSSPAVEECVSVNSGDSQHNYWR